MNSIIGNLPAFITRVDTTGTNREPHFTVVRPPFNSKSADEAAIIERLPQVIKDTTVDAVLRFNRRLRWTRSQALNLTSGILLVNNITNDSSKAAQKFSRLGSLGVEDIEELILRIQQSNETITVFDLEWHFAIDPRTIRSFGHGDNIPFPKKWVHQCFKETWHDENVNCGAFAIVWSMNHYKGTYGSGKNPRTAKHLTDCEILCREMNWSNNCTLEELETFTKVYKDYRLVILTPTGQCVVVYDGEDYKFKLVKSFPAKTVYLVYIGTHFVCPESFKRFINETRGAGCRWCHECLKVYYVGGGSSHICPSGKVKVIKRKRPRTCAKCGIAGDHQCLYTDCRHCSDVYVRRGGTSHRCLLEKITPERRRTFNQKGEDPDGKQQSLWVYDIESGIEIIPVKDGAARSVKGFVEDSEGYYTGETTGIAETREKHVPMFLHCKNVFTGESYSFEAENCIVEFISFLLSYNKGRNVVIAHNGSGYDTRLVFAAATKLRHNINDPILRGAKIVQMKIENKIVFRDSLLHLKGSLAGLAKDFAGENLRKGHFPHRFNLKKNWEYVGPIPDKPEFDLRCKTLKALDEFDEWHDTWKGRNDWNFMKELKAYCINDVEVLAAIVLSYHHECIDNYKGASPWLSPTAPSFFHGDILEEITRNRELEVGTEGYEDKRLECLENSWIGLTSYEHGFARKALRGGRTEVRKIYHKVSKEDWAKGVRIRYQDICSEYPYQQIVHDFPVGQPTIYIYDKDYRSCTFHTKEEDVKCKCEGFHRNPHPKHIQKLCYNNPLTKETILGDPDFFGIVCASVRPNKKLYVPVLPFYDDVHKKCIFGNNDIQSGFFTSVEFVEALKQGYEIIKVHAYHKYKRAPSMWIDYTTRQYIQKMINSREYPGVEGVEEIAKAHTEKFGETMGDSIREISECKWGKNPCSKLTAKIGMNSCWGKHCEQIIKKKTLILDCEDKNFDQDIVDFFSNISKGLFKYYCGYMLSETKLFYQYTDGEKNEIDLHKSYVPAAVFVPAYGRLQLLEPLTKLKERILMNDTDSIVYLYIPGEYNIPEGSLLGDWEVEGVDKDNGGIVEFVGMAPKTYALKCFNGTTLEKAKGLSLSLKTSRLFNFDVMRKIVQDEMTYMKSANVGLPQSNMIFSLKEQIMVNRNSIKVSGFDRKNLKGTLSSDGFLYPFGFQK